MIYMNLHTGRKVERPTTDPWLEASDGWQRLWEPPVSAPAEDQYPAFIAEVIEPSDDGDKEEI